MVAQIGRDAFRVAQEAGERFGPGLDPAGEYAITFL